MDPPGIEPGSPACRAGVVPLDYEPVYLMERRGVEPRFPGCKPSVVPLDQRPIYLSEVRPGIEPGLPRYQGGVLPKHLQTDNEVIPDGVEPSFPVCKTGVVAVGPRDHKAAGVGIEPTSRRSERRILPLDDPAMFSLATALRSHAFGRVCSVASSGGRNRTYGLLIQSQASLPTATTPECWHRVSGRRGS